MDILKNIKQIRLNNGVSQENLADALAINVSNYNRLENGRHDLKVNQLAIIAKTLRVDVIYLFTYPKMYVDKEGLESSDRISVTFEVSPDKRDTLLKMITQKE